MRISDWSSDVGSSDLRRRPNMALRITTFSNVTGGASFFKAVGHTLAAPTPREMLDRLAKAGPVAVYDQTRRASCRERVGQSVYISVVPGYLKPQETHYSIPRRDENQ